MNITLRVALTSLLALIGTAAFAQSPLPKADPASVGLSPDRLAIIRQTLQSHVDGGQAPGSVIAIARRGQLAYFEAVGFRNKAANVPMTTDTIFTVASMTKPMVAVAVMILNEEGRIALSDPIGKYLPQLADLKVGMQAKKPDGTIAIDFVAADKQPTIQDLLRHTAGMPYSYIVPDALHKMWPSSSASSALAMNGDEFLSAIGKLPLTSQPGTAWEYGLSYDVLGLLVEKVSGKSLGSFMRERIWEPLGMVDTSFALTKETRARFAETFSEDPMNGRRQFVLHADDKPLKFECGGGCATSTASDFMRFALMLLNGGVLDNHRILSRTSVAYMTADHLGPDIENNVSKYDPTRRGYGFGLGVMVRQVTGVAAVPGSPGDFNWAGTYGTYFSVDPKEQLAVVYMGHTPGQFRTVLRPLLTPLVLQAIVD